MLLLRCAVFISVIRSKIEAGYGVVFGRLKSGEIAVVYTVQGVADPSVLVGDIVLTINGLPADLAVAAVSVRWSQPTPATSAHVDSEKLRFLSRAPIGMLSSLSSLHPFDCHMRA